MNREHDDVFEFMVQCGQQNPENRLITALPSAEVQKLRMKLIREETAELQIAFIQNDLVEVADALADLLYVTYGAAVACGIDIEPIFDEVHKSNMTKFIDGHKEPGGKWIKGPSYVPPQLEPILLEQGWVKAPLKS